MLTVGILLALAGLLLIISGISGGKVRRRPVHESLERFSLLEGLVAFKPVEKLLELLTSRKNILFKLTAFVMEKTGTLVDVKLFFLFKLASFTLVLLVVVSVSFTNVSAVRKAHIIKCASSGVLGSINGTPGVSGLSLYETIKRQVNPGLRKRLDFQQKQDIVEKILTPLMKDRDSHEISVFATKLVKAFDEAGKLRVLNPGGWVLILLSYWFPELFVIIRRALQGSRYKKEVVKLENVFELLGGIKGFRTIDILHEMARASPLYESHFNRCMVEFKTEKQAALDRLKISARNGMFARLVDILRIYALTDKSIALDILERNRLEREEQLVMTAEEDVDLLDMMAFLSVVPVLLELAELIIRPMMELINEAFVFMQ